MVNISAKFDKETSNGVVSIVFTWSTHGQTDGTTAALLYPHRNVLRRDKKITVPSHNSSRHMQCSSIDHFPHKKLATRLTE